MSHGHSVSRFWCTAATSDLSELQYGSAVGLKKCKSNQTGNGSSVPCCRCHSLVLSCIDLSNCEIMALDREIGNVFCAMNWLLCKVIVLPCAGNIVLFESHSQYRADYVLTLCKVHCIINEDIR